MSAKVIGVDPGPTPGVVGLVCHENRIISIEIVQCSANALFSVLAGLDPGSYARVAGELFVPRGRATADQSLTRDMAALLASRSTGGGVVMRTASQVKAWATDERLEAAGLLEATKGMQHARDAARHALFAAVKDCGQPDPLSRKARA